MLGLPSRHASVDLVQLCVNLYPGDIDEDLNRLNVAGMLKRKGFNPVTPREWLAFWGLVAAASQYHARGKELWMSHARRGIRDVPNFSPWMMHCRFEKIRRHVVYSKADLTRVLCDPWSWFRPVVADFNVKHRAMMHRGLVLVLDESMSAFRPRKDKFGGLPNLSSIARIKPKPLGTEFKCVADATTGVMLHLEIQEGRDAMRSAEHVADLGVTTTCTVRLGKAAGGNGNTVVGDSWFGSVKVSINHYIC